MCFSARINQNLHSLARVFGAAIDWPKFDSVFKARLSQPGMKIGRALEANFTGTDAPAAQAGRLAIESYRGTQATAWEQELFKQKRRLADAERDLQTRDTKKARESKRIATDKIASYLSRLSDLRRAESRPDDSRIFPMWYAPVVISEN